MDKKELNKIIKDLCKDNTVHKKLIKALDELTINRVSGVGRTWEMFTTTKLTRPNRQLLTRAICLYIFNTDTDKRIVGCADTYGNTKITLRL